MKPLLSRIITGPSVEMEDKNAAEAPSATIPSAKAPVAKADVLNPAGKDSMSAKKMAASKQKALAYTGASTDGAVTVSVLTILTGAAAFLASITEARPSAHSWNLPARFTDRRNPKARARTSLLRRLVVRLDSTSRSGSRSDDDPLAGDEFSG